VTARQGRRRPAPEPPEAGAASTDPEPDPEQVARSIALRMLTGAPRSRHQLAEAMARKDVPADVAQRVLDRFGEVGLVDDASYAEAYVRSAHEGRALGRRALAMELRRRGVADEDAVEALAQVGDQDEESAARDLLRRRWRPGLEPQVQARRMLAMLARKGYPSGMATRLVREMVDDRASAGWDPSDAQDVD
jgi:regulatory protein